MSDPMIICPNCGAWCSDDDYCDYMSMDGAGITDDICRAAERTLDTNAWGPMWWEILADLTVNPEP